MVRQASALIRNRSISPRRDPRIRGVDLAQINNVLLSIASLLIASLFER